MVVYTFSPNRDKQFKTSLVDMGSYRLVRVYSEPLSQKTHKTKEKTQFKKINKALSKGP